MTEEREGLQELIKKLLYSVHMIFMEGMSKKRFRPEQELFFKRKVDGFKYDDKGAHIQSWRPERVLKQAWHEAVVIIEQETKTLKIYDEVLKGISDFYGMERRSGDYYLARLINEVAREILEQRIVDKPKLELYVTSFLKDLSKESRKYKLIAQLNGIILQPDLVQIDGNTLLRKPNLEDVEVQYPADTFFLAGDKMFTIPPAILEIIGEDSSGSLFKPQVEIEEAIAIFRLFRVGGVEYVSFTTYTDSLLGLGLISAESMRLEKFEHYLIKSEDVKELQTFWINIKGIGLPIPIHTVGQKTLDELSIAYERYSDSLEGGIIEKRISSAVMGLEALYLSPSEQQEMSYRLRMRVSKLLSIIGYNPKEVQERMKDAYNEIRSSYVHGGILKQKDRRKLEKKYGDINEFSRTIIDYLRASIVALLQRPSKNSLIQKIDDSFLDSRRETEIRQLLFKPYD